MIVVRIFVGCLGAALVVATIHQAVRTFVVPRAVYVPLSRLVFVTMRRVFNGVVRLRRVVFDRDRRDAIMANWAPLSLVVLPVVWLVLALCGYAAIFWSVDQRGVQESVRVSGSSLLTLGFATPGGFWSNLVCFSEACVGVALLALVISYLPSIYGAYSRRELIVAMLDARAGLPPSPVRLLELHHQYGGLPRLDQKWGEWEQWIVDIGESHLTHPALPFFRSATPEHSWLTAAATLLDAANLRMSAVVLPSGGNADAWMYLLAGTGVVRRMAAYFRIPIDHDGPLRLSAAEFDVAIDELAAAGVPIDTDRAAIWERFSRRRAQYEPAVLGLAGLLDAAPAPWSSDRALPVGNPRIFRFRG